MSWACVGEFTRHLNDRFNYNAIPAGARFDPANRDETQTPIPSNPRALIVVTSYQVEIPNGSGFHNHDVSFFKDFVVRGNPTSGL